MCVKEVTAINSNAIITRSHVFFYGPAIDLNFVLSTVPCRGRLREMVRKQTAEEEDLMLSDMCQRLLLSDTHARRMLMVACSILMPVPFLIKRCRYTAITLCVCVLGYFDCSAHPTAKLKRAKV